MNNFNKSQILYCQYCGKECKNLNSLKQHECRCQLNPNKIDLSYIRESNKKRIYKTGFKGTNQFIKAKELGLEIPKVSNETKEKISKIWKGKKLPKEMKEKIKKSIKEKVKNENWHLSFSKSRTIEYNGIKFLGSWEVKFAKYLDNKNIKWERPHKTYKYIFENETHRYLPDFYLPEYNLYIEIKGYPSFKDFSKWEQFPNNLDIYFGDDLYNLGIIDSYKDKYQLIDKKFRIKHIQI